MYDNSGLIFRYITSSAFYLKKYDYIDINDQEDLEFSQELLN